MSDGPEMPRDIETATQVTGAHLLRSMRDAVAPAGKKGTWLRMLSDKQLAEVYHRLRLGQPAYKIAQIAQREWGVKRRANVKSLARAVRKFKEDTLGLLQVEKTAPSEGRKEMGRKMEAKALKIVEKVDGLGRLGWLIERQTERIELLLEREKNALPFQMTNKEIGTLTDMIEKYVQLQIKLGVIDAKPSEINLNIKHKFDALMSGTVQGGTAVLETADKWLQKCEENALTLRLTDGRYELVKEEADDACETKAD